ncbi:MAG: tyrosine-type recombinase/integrase [Bacteroidota bacterium]
MPFSDYLEYIQYEKRYSQHTCISAQTDLKQFSDYLLEHFEIFDLNIVAQLHIRSWIAYLAESGLSNRTIQRKLSTLRSFYKFKMRNQEMQNSPLEGIIAPKNVERLPQFIEQDSITKSLMSGELFEDSEKGERDAMILKLLYYTGMRLSELIHIKMSDIDVDNKTIRVVGKRNKERLIPISEKFVKEIQNYKLKREGLKSQEKISPFLLLTDGGKKLYPKFVYRKVNQYLTRVTTLTKKSPHVLRHSFATHMLNNGADLNAIKEILGHADLTATQVYTHNSIEKLKYVHKQAHPKG